VDKTRLRFGDGGGQPQKQKAEGGKGSTRLWQNVECPPRGDLEATSGVAANGRGDIVRGGPPGHGVSAKKKKKTPSGGGKENILLGRGIGGGRGLIFLAGGGKRGGGPGKNGHSFPGGRTPGRISFCSSQKTKWMNAKKGTLLSWKKENKLKNESKHLGSRGKGEGGSRAVFNRTRGGKRLGPLREPQ